MATVDLRASAHAAWEAKETDRITAARDALGAVIGAANAAEGAVDPVTVESSASGYTVIFVDASGVHVSVSMSLDGSAGEVHLAQEKDDGTWAWLGEPVTSLAHLWRLIDQYLPVTYPEWATLTQYAVDDVVTYNGEPWRCTQAHTSQADWYPGAPGVYLWARDA